MEKKFIALENKSPHLKKSGGDKVRLDKFLKENLMDLSRSKIQDLIIDGFVKVNSKIINKKHYWLAKGDEVILTPSVPRRARDISPLKRGRELEKLKKQIKVIKKTKDYVLIEKPAGLIVHGTKEIQQYSLVDWLKKKYPQIKAVGDSSPRPGKDGGGLEFRPGIVHRLDKRVSGLMVIALNQESFENLKAQFKDRNIVKKYLALVYGEMEDQVGQVDFPIERSKRSGKMVAKPKHSGEKEALTLWEVKEKFNHYTLLEVQIKTGRNHQIRAHLQAINHPVVGDNLYNIKKYKDKFNLQRVFLHAYHLEFTDLSGEVQKFEIDLPEKLEKVVKELTHLR